MINGNPSITRKGTLFYLVRLIGCALLTEVMLHTMYVQAAAKGGGFENYTVEELHTIGYLNLKFVWLKVFGCGVSLTSASHHLALLPPLGPDGWNRNRRKHGALHDEQLLDPRVLEGVALLLQPLARALHVHPPGGCAAGIFQHLGHLYLRGAMARPGAQTPGLGLDHLALLPA